MKIFITSVGTATSVNLIKYFKKLDLEIVGCDINDYGYTAGSMMVDRYYKVPLAVSSDYIPAITRIIDDEQIDLIIPINDIEIVTISNCEKQIKCECIIPKKNVLDSITDKLTCAENMKRIGISIPEVLENDDTTTDRIIRDREGVGSKGIHFLFAGELCPQIQSEKQFLQRCVKGDEYTVDVLCNKNGQPIYIVPRKRIEVKNGVATKVLIEEKDSLINAVKTIVSKYCLPGFSNIQFIVDSDSICWFIEINPRFSGCGAATLATCDGYLESFLNIIRNDYFSKTLNEDVKWGSVVTRYYEEKVYEASIS